MTKQARSGKKTSQITWDTFKPKTKRPMSGVIVIKPKKKVSKPTVRTTVRAAKAESMIVNNAGVKVGDIFYSSWGYDQTNIDFYQVVGITPSGCYIREIGAKAVDHRGYDIGLMPAVNQFTDKNPRGEFKRTKISTWGSKKEPYFRLTSYSSGWLWDGKPKYETAPGYGH